MCKYLERTFLDICALNSEVKTKIFNIHVHLILRTKEKQIIQKKEIEKNSNNISTAMFQLDFEIFRTIASFIKIS
jgi:hypothetical protein